MAPFAATLLTKAIISATSKGNRALDTDNVDNHEYRDASSTLLLHEAPHTRRALG